MGIEEQELTFLIDFIKSTSNFESNLDGKLKNDGLKDYTMRKPNLQLKSKRRVRRQ